MGNCTIYHLTAVGAVTNRSRIYKIKQDFQEKSRIYKMFKMNRIRG